ncbi:P-loop containing nucleoside triphosphate hydrolase protein [Kockovaella imperatae]|uniref:RNA helicase n=1 Tax=Kockovaella imperatae TaxID=4999 RepID=A0A1Y1UJU5_9TREE|nr:P-loop containing nucleoside triphosphate hydrolase protein [Kockovaella imperatae]ORX37774.1 P-loop containing nucleoside triphosphate hydrolase protein [Kockovaella imperatae]
MPDFILTIDSDDESYGESSKTAQARADDLNPEFAFDPESEVLAAQDQLEDIEAIKSGFFVDDIISRRLGEPLVPYRERKRKLEEGSDPESDDEHSEHSLQDADVETSEDEDGDGEGQNEEEEDQEDSEELEDENGDQSSQDSGSDSDESLDEAEETRKAEFFDTAPTSDPSLPSSFAAMNLSRPLLRGLTAMSLVSPTPIQARAIPLALQGRDLLGSAVTGSGKTAAFMIPILERLCYRDRGKSGQACRVLVLCPTRELAVQCEAVGRGLSEKGGLDVRFALLVGGLSLNAQAHTLRTLPDVLIATPGRLIDHLTNTPAFTLSALDVLVIDEADRMLEQGFSDELTEIVKACPRSRQTMLFSATMTDSVDELVRLSLNKPIRVFVDPPRATASGLTQEFVRIRSEEARSAHLLALCKRSVKERCIIFFRSKALAHQMKIIFGLSRLKAAELHGNLTQEQRLNALTEFKAGKVDYLLATDLASRGLDIKGIETVINYDMPNQLASYTHRVGRTARAGRKGRSISLVGEGDRKMLKSVVKHSKDENMRHRIIPSEAVATASIALSEMEEDITEILKEEREEKALRQADMEVRKGQNMVEHEAEIFARPARTWFQTEKEKQAAKNAGKPVNSKTEKANPIKRGKYDGLSRKAKRRKMIMEDEAPDKDRGIAAAIRSAKKTARPKKITELDSRPQKTKKSVSGPKKGKRSAFDSDKGAQRGGSGHEGMRAKPVKVNLSKKGKGGGGSGGKRKR